ncbi:uncharacterized protein LY89DRAFT_778146 [Mollisia scopiformis]|uniref:Uncharacterized protein n=1 Tax=Mollisia scopiformis TaxID=149040 RepID=A0A194XNE6_MOLSC|nr:uncharacterized protein LY89DRAFT_778146 [Mollisia scopiformis]KUJ21765.1 hypothetical protein LY89DRAFT_778146 [Mollisia scopiformis]
MKFVVTISAQAEFSSETRTLSFIPKLDARNSKKRKYLGEHDDDDADDESGDESEDDTMPSFERTCLMDDLKENQVYGHLSADRKFCKEEEKFVPGIWAVACPWCEKLPGYLQWTDDPLQSILGHIVHAHKKILKAKGLAPLKAPRMIALWGTRVLDGVAPESKKERSNAAKRSKTESGFQRTTFNNPVQSRALVKTQLRKQPEQPVKAPRKENFIVARYGPGYSLSNEELTKPTPSTSMSLLDDSDYLYSDIDGDGNEINKDKQRSSPSHTATLPPSSNQSGRLEFAQPSTISFAQEDQSLDRPMLDKPTTPAERDSQIESIRFGAVLDLPNSPESDNASSETPASVSTSLDVLKEPLDLTMNDAPAQEAESQSQSSPKPDVSRPSTSVVSSLQSPEQSQSSSLPKSASKAPAPIFRESFDDPQYYR